jgi:hypothetical protein
MNPLNKEPNPKVTPKKAPKAEGIMLKASKACVLRMTRLRPEEATVLPND